MGEIKTTYLLWVIHRGSCEITNLNSLRALTYPTDTCTAMYRNFPRWRLSQTEISLYVKGDEKATYRLWVIRHVSREIANLNSLTHSLTYPTNNTWCMYSRTAMYRIKKHLCSNIYGTLLEFIVFFISDVFLQQHKKKVSLFRILLLRIPPEKLGSILDSSTRQIW